ncbi:MAG: hypothetical protein Q8L57_02985 [bacterium]|nr:hypothetical protein [bacterium]
MAVKDIKIGFSTSDFYKSEIDLFECLGIIRGLGCRALEIGFLRLNELYSEDSKKLTADNLGGFEYVSLHAPKFDYADNNETRKIFEKISKINVLRKLDAVVFHPDNVADFSIFDKTDFPVAFENMDNRKKHYRAPDEIIPLFDINNDFKLVLDLNHVCSNDPSMALATEFYRKFKSRITHIHLSGYAGYHEPLFQTKQLEIIRAVKNLDTPIIIESTVFPKDAKTEYDYILRNLI